MSFLIEIDSSVPYSDGMPSLDTSRANSVRSIQEAASAAAIVDAGGPFQGRSEVALSRLLFALDKDKALHAAPFVATVHAYTLEHVVLDADSLLLFQDGKLIPESEYFAPPEAVRLGVSDGVPAPVADVDYILGYNLVHWGYQHWVTQILPALDWAMQRPRIRPVRLVLPVLAGWQEEFLRILGYADVPRFTPPPGSRVRFRRLEFSEHLIGVHSFAISRSLRTTIGRILANIPTELGLPDAPGPQIPHDAEAAAPEDVATAPPPPGTRGKKAGAMLYVPGALTYYGTLQNEAEAIDLLRGRGVHILAPDLPAVERISLFRQADIVIGPLGQGLTDVAFCRPGALMWEWMPVHHQNVAFNRLAQAADVDYLGDVFPSTQSADAGWIWEVSLELLTARLDALAARLVSKAGRAVSNPPTAPAPDADAATGGEVSEPTAAGYRAPIATASAAQEQDAGSSPAMAAGTVLPSADPISLQPTPAVAHPDAAPANAAGAIPAPSAEPVMTQAQAGAGSAASEPGSEMFPPLAGADQPEVAEATPTETLPMAGASEEEMSEEQTSAGAAEVDTARPASLPAERIEEPGQGDAPVRSTEPVPFNQPDRIAKPVPTRRRSLLSRVLGRA